MSIQSRTKWTWVVEEALAIAPIIEAAAVSIGCHSALTGGLLYKSGERKDADFLIYRHSKPDMVEEIDLDQFFAYLEACPGFNRANGMDRCHKATYEGKPIDFLLETRIGLYGDRPEVGVINLPDDKEQSRS